MTAAAAPRPVTDVDRELRRTIRSVYRTRWVIVAAVVAVLAGAVACLGVLYGSQRMQVTQQRDQIAQQHAQIVQQERQLQSSCEFFRPLTGLPVTVPPNGKPPAALGVQIIAGARIAYDGQGCGHMPPPSPSLVTWARHYRIPVVR